MDIPLREKWIRAIGGRLRKWTYFNAKMRICQLHFDDEDIEIFEEVNGEATFKLKNGTVPKYFEAEP